MIQILHSQRRPRILAAVILGAVVVTTGQAELSFTWFGSTVSYINGMSNNGVAVGSSQQGAYRWTASGGFQPLDLTSQGRFSYASGISSDGTTIVGAHTVPDISPYRWTEPGGFQDIPASPGYPVTSPTSVSHDGSVVAMVGYDPDIGLMNTLLRNGAEVQPVAHLPGANSTVGYVADNGMVVGGTSRVITPTGITQSEAFRWTESEGTVGLGFPTGLTDSDAWAISGDGSTLVGQASGGSNSSAMRWTAASGMTLLGDLEAAESSVATDVNTDGSLIVGGFSNGLRDDAFVWTLETGMLSLTEVLEQQFGLGFSEWSQLGRATAVSANGRYIGGMGTLGNGGLAWVVDRGENPEDFEVPFQAVPEASIYGWVGSAILGALCVRRRFRVRPSA